MVLPVVGERLVERAVLLGGDVGRIARPERLRLVELDLLGDRLLDRLGLLVLLLLVDLLDLGLVVVVLPNPVVVSTLFVRMTARRREKRTFSSSSSSSTSFSTSLTVTSWIG